MRKKWLLFWSILKEWFFRVMSYASGGPTVLVALWYILTGREQPKIGLLILLGVCSIIAAWVALFQARVRQEACLKVGVEDFFQFSGAWKIETPEQRYQANPFTSLILRVENDPKDGTDKSQAVQVAARVSFHDEQGKQLFKFEGRWSDSPQPSTLPPDRTSAEWKTANILIGTTRLVDLVLKYSTDDVCYGVNNESYDYSLFKNEKWKLSAGVYLIFVRFRSSNVDQTFVLKFRNPEGKGSLEPISVDEIT